MFVDRLYGESKLGATEIISYIRSAATSIYYDFVGIIAPVVVATTSVFVS